MRPREILEAFDRKLNTEELSLEAVVIGGAALGLLGIVGRQTKDCDILHPALPEAIVRVARAFAIEQRQRGETLQDDWLNNGPASLTTELPGGWQERLQPAFRGRAITLRTLGRSDLLKTKLFALCDRGLDLGDCVALAPSASELSDALPWLERQDTHVGWPAHVRETIADLQQRLGHGV